MNIKNYLGQRKKGLILISIFFLLLILSLIFRKYFFYLFIYSLICNYLIILFSQFYDFENRIYVFCALILFIACFFFLMFSQKIIAEGFANYIYSFLCLSIIGIFLDNFKDKLKKNIKVKVYKISILIVLIIIILGTSIFYFSNIFISFKNLELFILKNYNNDIYYKQKYKANETMIVNGKIVKNTIKINVLFPENNEIFSNNIILDGWIINKNILNGTEVNKIELWLDGEPGEGKFLGNENLRIENNNIVENNDEQFKNYEFSSSIKIDNIKSGKHELYIYTHSDLCGWVYKKININIKNYSNDEKIKEAKLLNKNIKIYIDKPNEQQIIQDNFVIEGWAIDLNANLNAGIDSIEIWLDGLPGEGRLLTESTLNKNRSDVAQYFGKQQYLKSGYLFNINKNEIKKGNHVIFIFAHSMYSGWSFNSLKFEVK